MKTEQALSREDNQPDCNSLPQKLSHDGLQPSNASANTLERLGKPQSTLKDLLLGQNNCSNFSGYKIYLCDYRYEGHTWSIEIHATSFEDATKRLRAIQQGEIVGELKASVFIPVSQSWLDRAKKWLTSFGFGIG
jgi:hypothetical protein